MKKHFDIITRGITAVLLFAVLIVPQMAHAVANQSLAAPVYERPDKNSMWTDITAAGSSTVPFIVANVHEGPGTSADPAYTTAISKNAAAGIRTLGYVQTNYQARSFKDAYNDIDAWYRLYPETRGIMIDLVKEGSTPEVCYVAGLYSHVKNTHPNDLVVLNPGTHISSAYEPYGDIFVNAATDYDTYQSWRPQHIGFEDKQANENRFWHLIYGTNPTNYNAAFEQSRNNNAGWVYVTDKTAPAPFTATPSYWQNEITDINVLAGSTIPNRGKTSLPRGCISLSSSAESTVDTTKPKQATTTSNLTISNTSTTYASEPLTQLQLVTLPTGVTATTLRGDGWNCRMEPDKKSCDYGAVLAPSAAAPRLTAVLQASCDYAGGDAMARLVNYAGNQWDVMIPIRPPIGCDPATPAGRLNQDTVGQVLAFTTQSVETTPDIAPLAGPEAVPDIKADDARKGLPAVAVAGIIILGALVVAGIVIGAIAFYRSRRYKVDI